ncbi:MAG: hypothetical protein ABH869_08250, partial [Candidatus Omnitrophota bacterium]
VTFFSGSWPLPVPGSLPPVLLFLSLLRASNLACSAGVRLPIKSGEWFNGEWRIEKACQSIKREKQRVKEKYAFWVSVKSGVAQVDPSTLQIKIFLNIKI